MVVDDGGKIKNSETNNNDGEDLSSKKDGGVLRWIITPGIEEPEEPTPGSSKDINAPPKPKPERPLAMDGTPMTIYLEGYHNGRRFDKRELDFPLGEGRSKKYRIPRGVEIALYKFKELEKSRLLLSSDYAFGQKGNEEFKIPPGADVTYIVELRKADKMPEWWTLKGKDRFPMSLEAKEKGTNYFKEGEYDLAVDQYDLVLRYLVNEDRTKGVEEEKRLDIINTCLLNKALCYLKLEEFDGAKDAAEKSLAVKKAGNIKALYRLGLALIGLGEPVEAKKRFQELLKEDPGNRDAQQKLILCNKEITAEKQRQKDMCKSMFGDQ